MIIEYLQVTWEEFVIWKKREAWNLSYSILKLLMVIEQLKSALMQIGKSTNIFVFT